MLRGHQRIILERVKGKSRRKVSAKHVHGDPAIPLPEKPSWQQPLSNTTAQLRVLLQKPKCHLLQGEGLPFETAATRSDSEIASVRLQITGVLARMSSAVHRPDRSLGLKVRTVGISNWPSNHRNLHTWFPYRNTYPLTYPNPVQEADLRLSEMQVCCKTHVWNTFAQQPVHVHMLTRRNMSISAKDNEEEPAIFHPRRT